MIDALLRRGIDDGTFRGDLTVDELASCSAACSRPQARMAAEHQAGVEKAAALITSVFLHGTAEPRGPQRTRPGRPPPPRDRTRPAQQHRRRQIPERDRGQAPDKTPAGP